MAEKKARKKKTNYEAPAAEDAEGKVRLLREIEQNAREEADTIISSAEKTKSQKIAAAEGKAKRIVKDAEERAAAKIQHINEQTDSSIQIQKKRIRLHQTEQIIRHIFAETRKKIEEKTGSGEYIDVLKDWTAEGILGIGTGEVTLFFSKEELPRIDSGFLEDVRERVRSGGGKDVEIEVSEEPEHEFGVRVLSGDGRLEYRNQISTRLSRGQTEYRKMINSALEIEGVS